MADTTPTLREAAQQALEAIKPVMAYGRFGTRDVEQAELQKAHAVLRAALAAEQARPDIIERLTYHALERDDLTLDDCLAYLAEGWKRVRGRTERQMVLQLTALLAGAPAAEKAVPVAWALTKQLEKRETTTNGYLWFSDPQNSSWEPLYRKAPAPARQEWKPIETAPIGRNVIVAAPMEAGGYYVEEAWFSEDSDQWWPANVDLTDAHGSPIYPTHWMPLPAAPITAAPAEGEKR